MIPINLKIKNFFSHRDTEIDFTKFNAALLIGNIEGDYNISNGSGKSAIFEAILWCLFNKARTASIDDIIMWNESNCQVEFKFFHHGKTYKVVRDRSRTKGTSAVSFKMEESGTWVDKSGSTARLTNEEITNVIRVDYKTFINSAYFRQNDISEFAESDPGRKKEILKSIIDISKWDEYEKLIKAEVKSHKTACEFLAEQTMTLDASTEDLANSKIRLKELQTQVRLKGTEREGLGTRIEALSEKYAALKQSLDTDQWDRVVEENARLESDLKIQRRKKESLAKEIKNYHNQTSTLESRIKKSLIDLGKIETDEEAPHKLTTIKTEKSKYQAEIASSIERLEELESIEMISGTCYVCQQSVSDELSDKLQAEHDHKVADFKKRVVFGKNRVNQLKDEIQEIETVIKNNKRYKALEQAIASSKSQLEMLSAHLERISAEDKAITNAVYEIENKIKSNIAVLDSLRSDDFNKLKAEIKRLKLSRISVQSSLEKINREVGVYSQKVINLEEKIRSMSESKKKLDEKQKKLLMFQRFAKLLGKNGIQTILLNAVIEDLETTSNDILTSICNEPFQIILETQRVGSDGISIVDTLDLKVKKDGITQNFKSLSGGEQFRISLALRIALSEISSKHGGSSLEFLLLDEINSPLDRHGTENLFVNVIKSLESKYKILVITHDDLLKEKFENVLDVTKVNGESGVKFISK
jgi:exonuclease SbcC